MADLLHNYLGEALALLCAVTWAFAVILFRRSGEAVHPIGLNMFKNLLAIVLILPTIWIAGAGPQSEVPKFEYLMLLASGALGIGVSDTLFFMSLNALGAGLLAIVDCLYSPFIILLSMAWLGESLAWPQWIGAALIVSAVLTALVERHGDKADRRRVMLGIIWGVLAMAANAVGIVMIKPLLDRSPVLWVTEWRLFGGTAMLLVLLPLYRTRGAILASIMSRHRWAHMIGGAFLGGYLSMMIWLAGMKFTQASIASALNQTTSIFIFILAALMLHEKMTTNRVIGIILGVIGAFLVTYY